ncbi:MAG: hypothetical protein J6U19_07905 [Oscillospiraceae bacterium]|nr:hypothetical protein [Oscillospiraceae bacterium]
MQYIIRAYDGKDKLQKRLEVRSRHLENILKIDGKIICGGGLLDEEGKMKGSAMVVEFDTREALDRYLSSEPYVTENVWETVEVEVMNVVIVNGEKVGK